MSQETPLNLFIPFSFPDLSNKKILVIGMGGGCDVISALGIAKIIEKTFNQQILS